MPTVTSMWDTGGTMNFLGKAHLRGPTVESILENGTLVKYMRV